MTTELLDYQKDGVRQMHRQDGRVLLSDSMGLGKSIQALYYIMESKRYPAIIVCPAALKLHWQREAMQHCGLKTTVLHGTSTRHLEGSEDIIILNYDILRNWLPRLRKLQPQIVVMDEVHYISSPRARRSKAAQTLCSGVHSVIGISGTPLTNRPMEMFTILNILAPDKFPSRFSFGMEFCDARRMFGAWTFNGAKNLKRLHKRLDGIMIRRTMEEVLPQLPTMRRMIVPLEIERPKEYQEAEGDFITWLTRIDRSAAQRAAQAEQFTRYSYLKYLAATLKMKAVMQWIDSFLMESDEKLMLGVWHKGIISILYEKYQKIAVVIDGSKTLLQRDKAEKEFRHGGTRILLGQIKAMGVGGNYPECRNVALCELPWAPGTCSQFAARCHRLTSTGSVNFYWLIAANTIEEKLCQMIQKKSKHLDLVLDGEIDQMTTLNVFDELTKLLRGEKHEV